MPLGKVDAPPKGREQQARASAITKDINSMQTQPPNTLPHYGAEFTNNFPANLVPKDAYDDTAMTKARNSVQNPYGPRGVGVQTVMKLTPEDVAYQKRKAAVANNLRYQTWLINNIDMANPKAGKGPKAKIKSPTRALVNSIRKQNKTGNTPKSVIRKGYKMRK
jgi:hypothetical protein